MIRLHHIAFSRSFRILWLLEELELEFEVATYDLFSGNLRDPEFLKSSPAGRVPALEIDGLTLCESAAIVQYLCERHPEAALAPLPGTQDRARFLEGLNYLETLAGLLEMLNVQRVFLRDPAAASPSVIKLTTARLKAVLRGLDAMLDGRAFIAGPDFTAADTMTGFGLFAAPYFVKLEPFANVTAYKTRLEARPGFQRAAARDGEQRFYDRDFYPVPEG